MARSHLIGAKWIAFPLASGLFWMSACAAAPLYQMDRTSLLVRQFCSACHGVTGNDTAGPRFPKLADQQYDYLVKQLRNFRAGIRNNPIMATYARLLHDEDVPRIAAYFSGQRVTPARPSRAERWAREYSIKA